MLLDSTGSLLHFQILVIVGQTDPDLTMKLQNISDNEKQDFFPARSIASIRTWIYGSTVFWVDLKPQTQISLTLS